jgi:hypothetical protein
MYLTSGRITPETRNMACGKARFQTHSTGPHAQARGCQTRHEEQEVEQLEIPVLSEATLPSAEAQPVVDADLLAGRSIETFVGVHGIFLDLQAEIQNCGEGVGELHDASCCDHGRDVGELWNLCENLRIRKDTLDCEKVARNDKGPGLSRLLKPQRRLERRKKVSVFEYFESCNTYSASNDKRRRPIHRYHKYPKDLSFFGCEFWTTE